MVMKIKKQKWSQPQLVVLATLPGVLATFLYDLFKAWLTPIMLEGRALKSSEAMATVNPVIAGSLNRGARVLPRYSCR